MNITELIERMRGFEADHEPDGWPAIRMREVSALCDSLLAQQAVIEKLVTFIEEHGQHTDGEYRFCCMTRASKPHESWCEFPKILSLQPDLTALREHDAEVCQEFANFLGIEKREDVVKWIAAVRKGE